MVGVTAAAVATLLALAGLLFAEWSRNRALHWVAKPLASCGFLAVALASGALESRYGRFIFVGLVLSLIGDVALIPKSKTWFLAGLGSFLVAHVAYSAAFLARGVRATVALVALAALALPAGLIARAIVSRASQRMKVPVALYAVAITTMVAFAAGTAFETPAPAILIGAVMFFVSDLAVARERFVTSSLTNKLWGLPLYYGGQIVLAWTTGAG